MSIIFDSYAWIEYFSGTKRGEQVKHLIDSSDQIYTPAICLTEIKAKYIREKREYADRIEFILLRSTILDLTKEIALLAAEVKQTEALATVDALIYATAKKNKMKLLSGDKHFEGKDSIEFLG